MLKRTNKVLLILIVPVVFATGTVFAKSKIEKLTSSKNDSSSTKEATPGAASISTKSEPSIPGKINMHSLGLGIGQSFLQGDFEKHGDNRITWDLYYSYSASHSFDLVANFHSNTHKFRQKKVRTTGLAFGIKAKVYQFDSFSPFGLAGLGFYSPKVVREVNGGELRESESKLVFGNHLGAGVDLNLNDKMTFGLLGHYHNPFDVKQEVGEEVEGSYFKLLITALYSFSL